MPVYPLLPLAVMVVWMVGVVVSVVVVEAVEAVAAVVEGQQLLHGIRPCLAGRPLFGVRPWDEVMSSSALPLCGSA